MDNKQEREESNIPCSPLAAISDTRDTGERAI